MNYANIKYYDISNGLGVRTSLFVSGCTHKCKGCFNEEAQDFHYGEPFTEKTMDTILNSMEASYIKGLSLLGGEPMEIPNQRALLPLLRRFKDRFPQKDIWCYTGYTYETDLLDINGKAHCEVTEEFLSYIDILVDGEFDENLYDISLHFRGSSNQRLLQIQKEGCPELVIS
ncbi:MAG: anaerobic ribonucleoside-triphosphate reductase activating protein [Clostridium sp.]|nr:anaerobic ribonucleoside-triphosphate reductase activating protein [Clostridium sp.]